MALVCAFTVYGAAQPQGSLTADRRGRMRHSNHASLMAWRSDIRAAMQVHVPHIAHALFSGPLAVRIVFAIPKPPSVSRRRLFPTVAPDLDRLVRAVGDALTQTVVRDDSQIVHWDAWKVYTDGPAEARIELWEPDAVVPLSTVNPFQQQGLF
ncbi:MAG TPA: RusA family crossover junction endodeoxyribonuclease [Vicinamibacterales bacterium]